MHTIAAEISNMGSVIVAVAIITLILIVTVIAMLHYDIDGVLKMWAALGTLSGLVAGTMATYFFTKDTVAAKDSQIQTVQTALTASEKERCTGPRDLSLNPPPRSKGKVSPHDIIRDTRYLG